MNKQLNKLTWKYFWEQKWEEISAVLIGIFILISFLGVLVQIGWINQDTCPDITTHRCPAVPYEPWFPRWIMITGLITSGIWIIIGIVYWISSNWEHAKGRAEGELKEKNKIRRKRK